MPTYSDPTPPVAPLSPSPPSPPSPPPPPPSTPPPSPPVYPTGPSVTSIYPQWEVGLFDLLGNQIADISEGVFSTTLTQILNGIDSYQFSVYLDDQAAYQIKPLESVIKVWRHVPGLARQPRAFPHFCGTVAPPIRNAAARTATYTAFSPFWRLQFRYHIDPHDFSWETGRGTLWGIYPNTSPPELYGGTDPSEIMWTMIQFTQNLVNASTLPVFNAVGKTLGIEKGGFATYFSSPPPLLENKYDRGQNTWDLIQEIVTGTGMPDLDPTYYHVDGEEKMMYFNTSVKKGIARSLSLDYRTGNKNLDDLQESAAVEPGKFATYVVVQGQADTNGAQEIRRADGYPIPVDYSNGTQEYIPPNNIDKYGLYMHFDKLSNASSKTARGADATYILQHILDPPIVLQPSLSAALVWAWPYDFQVGDTVHVKCDRDSMQIADAIQRIRQVTISPGGDGAEAITVELTNDYEDVLLT